MKGQERQLVFLSQVAHFLWYPSQVFGYYPQSWKFVWTVGLHRCITLCCQLPLCTCGRAVAFIYGLGPLCLTATIAYVPAWQHLRELPVQLEE